ncbi:hypothetical protein [Natronococcus wangiae]|uniref:hypothetical protein n=1 Tax=Natronococcus wangiae TaxID=3068275 RepID=UPI00273DF3EB|nr:hypothetical protein [Natronococcus sp. AD5]
MSTGSEPESFGAFFRRYTKTWMHAVATAGLTAFGMLSVVHRGFVVLALACYVVPPIVLYLSRTRGGDASADRTAESMSPTDAALAGRDDFTDESASEPGPPEPDERAPETSGRKPTPPDEADREPTGTADSDGDPAATTGTPDDSGDDVDAREEPTPASSPDAGRTGPDPDDAPTDGERTDAAADAEPRWTTVAAPTDATLLDAAVTSSGAIAVGDGGLVLERGPDTDDWTVVLEDGPAAQGQTLRGVDATDDGGIAWVAGDGGGVGRFECSSGRHTDYSAPNGRTDNLAGLAVAGSSGDETVLLINGSGEVIRGRYRDGELDWDEPVKPGSGSSLSDATLVDASIGYCCDTNDGVFETDDGGRTFETIGLEGADGTLTGIAAAGEGDCHVCTDAGVVHRFDGSTWTPERVSETALSAIARLGDRLTVCDEGGAVYERSGPTAEWERADAGSSAGLESVAVGADRSVAVGADGTVVERR